MAGANWKACQMMVMMTFQCPRILRLCSENQVEFV